METSKKNIISGMIWTFSERMLAQLVSLIVGIILARLLTPTEYGTVSLVTIFITISNVFVVNGFGTALIQKKRIDNIDYSTVLYFGIIFSLLVYIGLFLFAETISYFYNMPILIPILRVLAIKIPISSINSVQHAYVSRNMLFKKFFYSTLIGTIISGFVGVFMAYYGFGVWSLVGQELTNTIIDTVVLWFTVKWRPSFSFSFIKLKELFSYGWKLMIQGLLNTLYGNIRSLVIGKIYTADDLAFYTKGSRYPNLIAVNVDTAMGKALFPAMAREQHDYTKIKTIARQSTKICSYIMSPLLIGFAACAESFTLLILTEKWMPMVPFLRIICVCLLLRAAQTSTLQAIKATGRSDVVLKMDIPVRIFGIIALIISVKFGVIYVAVSEVVVECFCLVLYGRACKKVVGYNLREIMNDLGLNICQALIMGSVVWGFGMFSPLSILWTLLLQVIGGAILYLGLSVAFGNENFFSLRDMIKKVI